MLTYSFEQMGSSHLYEYLYQCIKNDIMSGKLKADDKLPSKRTFAKNLNISTITVENAYAQLMAEGYIYSLPKRGYFVSSVDTFSVKHRENIQESIESDKVSTYHVDLISNRIQSNNFPFSIWAKLTREVLSRDPSTLLTPPPSGGIFELRKAIAGYLDAFRGITVLPEQIIIGAGTEYLYGLLIQLFGAEETYALEDPGYQKISQIYASHNVQVAYIPMDAYGVKLKELQASGANILHLSPSHHYPTGRVTPIKRRYEVLNWASESEKRYIIEDDYDSEFRLMGKPIPTLQSIDTMGKVIYMNTFSKSLSSTIRISYMVLPNQLLKRFYDQLGFYSCTVSNFEQFILAKFISEGYFEKHINRMRNYYRNQRNQLLETIKKSPLAKRVHIREENSGLHFLMEIDTILSDADLEKYAAEKGVRLSCLSKYYRHPENARQHAVVINYSALEEEKMQEAIEVLESCILKNDVFSLSSGKEFEQN